MSMYRFSLPGLFFVSRSRDISVNVGKKREEREEEKERERRIQEKVSSRR